MSLNRSIIMGRMTRDPELKHTHSGTAVVSFTVAVERNYKGDGDNRETDFIDVVAWRGAAEFVCNYFTKGRMIVVEGSLQNREWKDKDGNTRRNNEIIADAVYFGDSKKESDANRVSGVPVAAQKGFSELRDVDEGELPF